jgi:hypothetical protein
VSIFRLSLLALVPLACVKPPDVVLVDRATALEQQAGGSFEDVEQGLVQRAVSPSPTPLTPDQLEVLGIKPAPLVDHTDQTDADRLDALLRQRCVGEGKDGLLVDTHDDCIGASDRLIVIALVDRSNRARLQLWRWMHSEQPDTPLAALRAAWHTEHAQGVVCRGWVQRDDAKWETKKC